MNILHIEKSSLISGIIRKIIEESGNSLISCSVSDEAIQTLGNKKIDLIIIGLDSENPEGELFLRKKHEMEMPLLPVIALTEDDDLRLNDQLFCYGVVDIINKKYISDENFKRFFDVYLREDRLLKDLRNISIAILDVDIQCLSCYKALFDFYAVRHVEYFSGAEDLLFCSRSHDFYILDISMPRVSGEKVVRNIRERNRDSFVTAVISKDNKRIINNIVVAGADSFIVRPFTANTFISRMKADVRHYMKIKSLQKKS